jgi:superfamily I DNA/RNA helicase
MAKLALSKQFLQAYARLPKKQQKKVWEFTEKFRADPRAPAIHLEPLNQAKDDKVRSVRIDKAWRAIVIQPPRGDVYLLVWVDHHDEAMAWAQNRRFEVNPKLGSLQIYDVDAAEQALVDAGAMEGPSPQLEPTAPVEDVVPPGRLLSGLSREDLLLCGVPEPLLPSARALRTELDLDDLSPHLPEEAADALHLVATGSTLDEALDEVTRPPAPGTVDPDDFGTAIDRPDSRRRFALVEDDEELGRMLEAPLQQWRVFLHPSQAKVVEMQTNSPARVLGGPGTGKTVVLMHRARHLAETVFTEPDDRLLVTTFTANLAQDLGGHLDAICGEERRRIDVTNLHRWALRFMRQQGVKMRVVRNRGALWNSACTAEADGAFPHSFYREEWDQVVQQHGIRDERGYLRVRRSGRGTALNRSQRRDVWKVLAKYRALLEEHGEVEWPDVIRETRLYLEKNPQSVAYKAVLADEAQDFSAEELRLLRAMVPAGPNDLFLAGDAHQRIYGHRVSLKKCGIECRGRGSRRLRVNYRTTAQIARWSIALLKGMEVDDLDDGSTDLKGLRSLRVGEAPRVKHFPKEVQEAEFITRFLKDRLAAGVPHEELCVVARTGELVDGRYLPILKAAGIEACRIETDAEAEAGSGVRVATMHRVKGLEFPTMVLAGVQQGVMPLEGTVDFGDAVERRAHVERERRLLFVAATRARDEVVICGFGQKSEFVGGN